jgi:PAS domain S-box-containing protein
MSIMNKSLKALIVEDSETDAELLVRELNRGGYQVAYERVDRPDTFQAALSAQPWDIIFSDHSMPQFSSTKALKIARESGLEIPFIIVSGTLGEEAAVSALKAGASDYFIKDKLARIVSAVERELRESEEQRQANEQKRRYNALLDASPDLVFMLDSQGRFNYVNLAAAEILSLSCQPVEEDISGILGRDAKSLGLPDVFVEQLERDRRRVLQGETVSSEIRLPTLSGERTFESMLSPMFTQSGEVDAIVSVTRDIEDRKKAEEALKASLEREKIIRHIVELVSQTFDLSEVLNRTLSEIGRFLGVDRCFIVRYQQEENTDPTDLKISLAALYRSSDEIAALAEEDTAHVFWDPKKQPDTDSPTLFLNLSRPSAFPPPLEAYAAQYHIQAFLVYNIFYRGQFYGQLVLHQCRYPRQWTSDEVGLIENFITHLGDALYQAELFRKEQDARIHLEESYQLLKIYTQKLEQSNKELEHFATIASHDLQAPLRKVMAFSDMLQHAAEGQLSDDCQDYISRMQKATQRMQNLITGLLDLSRVNRRGKPFTQTDLQEIMLLVSDELRDYIADQQGQVTTGTLCQLDADPDQLQQVLTNLVENALKFHREGVPPQVHVFTEVLEPQACQIIVQDNGIGIKPENLEKIFETFTRLHGQDEYPGTGIGLSLVKKIVERHGGAIAVQSVFGEGSRFLIQLPLQHR